MIRISELIKKLEELKETYGDVPVLSREDGFGGYAIHEAALPDEHDLYASDFEDVSDDKIKEFFPEWDDKEETLYDNKPISCVCMYMGSTIYST